MLTYYWRRIGAFIIDMSIISMLTRVFLIVLQPLFILTTTNFVIDLFKVVAYLLFLILVAVLYNMICYKFFNFTLGKLLLSIKVLDENKQRATMRNYFIREWNKYFYIYATMGIYVIYQFCVNVMKQRQTLHERKSNTHTFV